MARGRIRKKIGAWRLLERLGKGPHGDVYEARHPEQEETFAIKILRRKLVSDPEVVARLRVASADVARLDHPNLVAHFGLHEHRRSLFLINELVPGKSLATVIQRDGPLDMVQALMLVSPVLHVIAHAHRHRIVHGDLRATNMLLSHEGVVKVADAGIARALGAPRGKPGKESVESLAHLAPEQLLGEPGDARSDVYALGVLFYRLLTARLPFLRRADYDESRGRGPRVPAAPRRFAPHLPSHIEEALMSSLAARPAERPAHAGVLCEALEGYDPRAAAQDVAVSQASRVERLEVHSEEQAAPRRHSSWPRIAVGLAVVGLLAGLNLLFSSEAPAPAPGGDEVKTTRTPAPGIPPRAAR